MTMLDCQHLTMRFGGLTAVSDFNLTLNEGEMIGLIGPNGAGKSTVYNMISGFYKPTEGKVIFNGRDITGMKPHVISSLGIVRVFQNGRLFKEMNVLENMLVSHHMRYKSGWFEAIFHSPRYLREEKEAIEESETLLEKLDLSHVRYERASKLPFGMQRKLEVARALAARPKVLLLDEPATGLNVEETNDMMDFILNLQKNFHLTILLIEHTMRVVMSVCPNIIVLDHGETIAWGCPDEIKNNEKVIQAYLGVD